MTRRISLVLGLVALVTLALSSETKAEHRGYKVKTYRGHAAIGESFHVSFGGEHVRQQASRHVHSEREVVHGQSRLGFIHASRTTTHHPPHHHGHSGHPVRAGNGPWEWESQTTTVHYVHPQHGARHQGVPQERITVTPYPQGGSGVQTHSAPATSSRGRNYWD